MTKTIELSDNEKDLLGEAFNIGVGNAANSLSQMVRQEVLISIPDVQIMSMNEMVDMLGGENMVVCGVSQEMKGGFESKALMILPQSDSVEIIKLMLGTSYDYDTLMLLHQDAIKEVGNILLNACIASVSDFLNMSFEVGVPEYHADRPQPLMQLIEKEELDFILHVQINLTLVESGVHGIMGFVMGPKSFSVLRDKLKSFLDDHK